MICLNDPKNPTLRAIARDIPVSSLQGGLQPWRARKTATLIENKLSAQKNNTGKGNIELQSAVKCKFGQWLFERRNEGMRWNGLLSFE
jgi:hypothetical protein